MANAALPSAPPATRRLPAVNFPTPLAWRNLTYNPRRLAVALCGIGFAVVLIFSETGFENALFDSAVQVFDKLNADLILSSAAYKALISQEKFPLERIAQAREGAGVKAV